MALNGAALGKNSNIELLRAIAASAVVAYHTLGGLKLKGLDIGFWSFLYPLGAAGVDVFFVISGFVILLGINNERKPAGVFLRARVIRIVPAYWIVTLITVASTATWSLLSTQFGLENSLRAVSIEWLLESLTFSSQLFGNGMPVVGQGWSLEYEMFFYLLITFALLLRRKIWVYFIPASVLLSLAISGRVSDMVIEFLVGMALAHLYARPLVIKNAIAASSLILGCLVFAYSSVANADANPTRVLWLTGSAFVVFGVIYLRQPKSGRISNYFIVLGGASYAVYLIHGLTYPFVNFIFGRFPTPSWITISACVVSSLLVAQVCGILFERFVDLPIRRVLTRKFLLTKSTWPVDQAK